MKVMKLGENGDRDYENIMSIEVLIIDDLGTESATSSRYAELLELLNTREANNRISPCKTIFSTNLSAKEIYDKYSERIGSRIVGSFNIYRLIGDDIRIYKKQYE
jgi:DNA replication protein DnaC